MKNKAGEGIKSGREGIKCGRAEVGGGEGGGPGSFSADVTPE